MNQYTGIEEYWSRLTRVQDEISFKREVLVDTEEAGIAHWRASFLHVQSGRPVDVDGIFVVRLDADSHRARSFRERWHLR
jgi:hypothetical protein